MISNSLEARILSCFLENPDDFISGESLAQRFELSRVSIWSRFEKWRERGFEFEAVRNRGYALRRSPAVLDPDVLGAWLLIEGVHERCTTDFLEETDSTNSEVERRLSQGGTVPLCVIARTQTKGRGRQGRVWHSPEGTLCLSLGFRPQIKPTELGLFPLWIGVMLSQWLKEAYGANLGVKWPNDLIAEGSKVGGILLESRIERDLTRDLVVGIGLNVNSLADRLSEVLEREVKSLNMLTGGDLDLNRFAVNLLKTVLEAYDVFVQGDYKETLMELWSNFDALKDQPVTRHQHDGSVKGIARGIDVDGGLIFEDTDGTRSSLHSGEVSLTHNLSGGSQ